MEVGNNWIVNSLLEADFYNFTMGQFVYRHYPRVKVTYVLRCRTKNVHLGKIINLERLRAELDHVRALRFNNSELHYLRGTDEFGDRMFCEPYLDFLEVLQLPGYELEVDELGDIKLTFTGYWPEAILWETLALSIINQLYNEVLMRRLTPFERDVVYAKGRVRLAEKIEILREKPHVLFSDFGTRRRFSGAWQQYVVETLRDELPKTQFRGTSNTDLAFRTGVLPMGTSAHQLYMVIAGLMEDEEDWLAKSQRKIIDLWWGDYGAPLSIFLSDTFGTDFFLSNLTKEDLEHSNGFRQDSGDPFDFIPKILPYYQKFGIDPRNKLVIPSDGLTLPVMCDFAEQFQGIMKVSAGWGTNLTNDLFDNVWRDGLWYGPLSLVVKPMVADGHHLVKLSDNPAKAMGRPEDIERYMRAAHFDSNTKAVECVY